MVGSQPRQRKSPIKPNLIEQYFLRFSEDIKCCTLQGRLVVQIRVRGHDQRQCQLNVNQSGEKKNNHGFFDIDVDIDVGRGLEHESVLQVVPIDKKKFFFLLEQKTKVNWHITKDNYLEKYVHIGKN